MRPLLASAVDRSSKGCEFTAAASVGALRTPYFRLFFFIPTILIELMDSCPRFLRLMLVHAPEDLFYT